MEAGEDKTREEGSDLRTNFMGDMESACDDLDKMIGDLEVLHEAVGVRLDATAVAEKPATPLSHSSLIEETVQHQPVPRKRDPGYPAAIDAAVTHARACTFASIGMVRNAEVLFR